MEFQTICYSVENGVARLTMNRPKVRNGLNDQMARELREAVRLAVTDAQVRTLLLTGSGSAFCSGADLGNVDTSFDPACRAAQSESSLRFVRDAINPLMISLHHCPKPVVAAVNGPVVGGGIGLALAADIVVATESARFLPKFTPLLALIPDLGCTWMLPRLIGRARTLGLSMLGETFSARQAEEWGLIWRCYPDSEFSGAVDELTAQLARGPIFALAAVKTAIRESAHTDYDQQLLREMELSAQCVATADFAEGAAAFLSKRPPVFGSSGNTDCEN
ncbi:enoyl-CoA hydratase-related protein [Noviherbaspirillum sedimenti]|uniref:2-(1,2-epoxy-1,2-dihydrophenyl)acetyl-CoA isomerase n=1 Tax=Noviherbaspirillum sedimenti TaxID=2320865 RepID=A0A3A3G3Z8_9BURK|nr:enoyl-CoA hydratase-related protein [Noviherbaspirillum sedimenti]RJG02651.1 2-(1,2-epoxy-1,2-dihydrophenyl)acetyl-CoA isomerase [Noviherbaspirillum sedimenti]